LPPVFSDADNLLPEEKAFLFWMDAYWGQKSSSIQAIELVLAEAMDMAKEKVELPAGLKAGLKDALERAETDEQRSSIESSMLDAPIRHRQMEIAKVLDMLDNYLSPSEASALKIEYTNKTSQLMRSHGK